MRALGGREKPAHRAFHQGHAFVNGVRPAGIDDEDEARGDAGRSNAFMEVISRESRRSRMNNGMEKRLPNVQLARLFGPAGSHDGTDRGPGLTRCLACAASGMIDSETRRFDRSGLEHAFERAVIGRWRVSSPGLLGRRLERMWLCRRPTCRSRAVCQRQRKDRVDVRLADGIRSVERGMALS